MIKSILAFGLTRRPIVLLCLLVFVGALSQCVPEERPNDDPANRSTQLPVREQLAPGSPGVERAIHLFDHEVEVAVDPLGVECRLHEAPPPFVNVTIAHHECGVAVDRREHLERIAPPEGVDTIGEDELVRVRSEQDHELERPCAELHHRPVPLVQVDERLLGLPLKPYGGSYLRIETEARPGEPTRHRRSFVQ